MSPSRLSLCFAQCSRLNRAGDRPSARELLTALQRCRQVIANASFSFS